MWNLLDTKHTEYSAGKLMFSLSTKNSISDDFLHPSIIVTGSIDLDLPRISDLSIQWRQKKALTSKTGRFSPQKKKLIKV